MDKDTDRYVVVEEPGMSGYYGVVVDTQTGLELCPADSCEAPEDASVYRAFAPLLEELNRRAREIAELKALVKDASAKG